MNDRIVKIELRRFAERIFNIEYIDEAKTIKKEYDKFCHDNKVSPEQLTEFAASGAGEMLRVLTSYN